MRGPAFAPALEARDLAQGGVPAARTPGERFDLAALAAMQEIWPRFPDELSRVQLAVEEVPMLPHNWSPDAVPLSSYVAARGREPARLVLLRRPIEHRADSLTDLNTLVLTVLIEQVAEILGLRPEEVHPDYAG